MLQWATRTAYYSKYKENYAVGYTIRIAKSSEYGYIQTLHDEIDRLKNWVERQTGGELVLLEIPNDTHYRKQYAIVTIFDPVMKHIESFIPSEEQYKKRFAR
jgi:hypothetical protein